MKPNRRWRIKLLWLFLGLGLAFTTLAATRSSGAVVVQTTTPPPPPVAGRAGPLDPASPLPPTGAPGYCPSAGGSTTYEQILNVTFIPKDDLLEVTIPIQIANPNGCTYGKPCPSYDNSPEYVNGWIDWNGNQQWEAGEQVINKDLRAASINYHGTMTVKDQVRIPATSVESTWLRANLGYGYDANDPCTASWAWGNVVDKPIAPKASLIKEIKVKGEKEANNPMTGYYVTLEAVLDLPTGYTVEKIRWSGDVEIPGEGNPYSFKPFKGEHGLRKVKATLTYRNSATNTTGTVAKEHEFKLFFEKNSDDDGDGLINWFEYWGRDGAVPGLLPKAGYAPLIYDPKDPDYGTWKDQEQLITLGVGVANEWHYEGGRTVPVKENCVGGTFGGTAGIDAVAEVISHERWHEFIWRQWHGGPWQVGVTLDTDDKTPNQKGDNIGDDLPDDFERNDSRTNPDIVDSCNLVTSCSGCWTYKGYADNEFTALLASKIASTVPAQDWANPGKQSNPPFVPKGLLVAAAAAVDKASGPLSGASPVGATALDIVDAATLTGSYVDSSLDANGDGQSATLRITVGVNVSTPAQYTLIGWLRDSNGVDFAWASVRADLTAGAQSGELDFDGKLFQMHGVNGPYTLHHIELRVSEGSAVAAFADNVYTTAAYAAGSFTPPAVSLTGSYSDHGVDTDSDGLYNALDVTVDIQINTPGAYTVQGWLYDANGQPIAGGDARAAFTNSGTQTLAFQGRSLRWQRANGPYQVRFLEVLDAALNRVLLVESAYTTAAYTASQFQGANAAGTATIDPAGYSDQGLDVNGDGKFEYLRVALQVNATTAGAYHLEAALQANARTTLVSAENDFALVSGNNAMTLDFPGGALSANGANGPYQVAAVTLLDSAGNVVDYQKLAHATQAYAYTDFAPPLISLTNQYREEARDTNGDGGYDLLNIAVGVSAGNNGFVVAQGRLMDSNGHEIQWVEQTVPVTAGVAQSVTLPFSATLIVANGQDGPYYLRNLLLYHTGDPLQALSVANAYTTAAYHYRDFLPAGPRVLYLPVVAKAPPTPTPTPPGCVPGPLGESNDVADAILICSGQTVTGQVSQSDKDDVYRFKAAANQAIDIVLHGTGGDADLYLFAPGTTNVTSDPWAARSVQEGNDELIQGTLLVGGDWFVDVYAFSGASEYSLVVALSSMEVTSAQTMTATMGAPVTGSRSSK